MKVAHALPLIMMMTSSPRPAIAQDAPPAAQPPKAEIPPLVKNSSRTLTALFSGPLHLAVDGVASGGGLAGGIAGNVTPRDPINLSAKALYSIRKYWLVEGVARYEGRRAMFETFARARDLTAVAFSGLGPDSRFKDRTGYAAREDLYGVDGSFRLAPWVSAWGLVRWVRGKVGQYPKPPTDN